MASLNKVLLMGNLTRDPELRYTPGGQAVCDLGLAVNRRYTVNGQDRDDVCFLDIVVWAKQAESCSKYLHKGSPVFIEGRLHYDTWEDKEGNKKGRLRITAERVQFLSSKSDSQSPRDANRSYQAPYQNSYQPSAPQMQPGSFAAAQAPPTAQSESGSNQNVSPTQPGSFPGQAQTTSAETENIPGQGSQEPGPMPAPEVFDNNAEPEDDIPF